jgi:hypothetical protein
VTLAELRRIITPTASCRKRADARGGSESDGRSRVADRRAAAQPRSHGNPQRDGDDWRIIVPPGDKCSR